MNFVSAMMIIAATAHSGEPTDYKTAYHCAMNCNKPLLVLVTAEWCPPCQKMKSTTIPAMIKDKKFSGVLFATVDLDKDAKIARKLIGTRGVPQLVLFEKKHDEWSVKYLAGAQSVASVEKFVGYTAPLPSPLRTAQADAINK